jgi:uncharacterized protein (DUF305 family)
VPWLALSGHHYGRETVMKHPDHTENMQHAEQKPHGKSHYPMFALMMVLGTIIMFLAMYEMIADQGAFVLNLNMFYMALTMAAPMAILELALMSGMYPNKRLNLIIYAVSVVVLVGSFFAVRTQTAIGDQQFLASMIPHHSGAILMCKEASITDPEIKSLCDGIIQSQAAEIAQMKALLERY